VTTARAATGAPDPVCWVEADGLRLATMRRGAGLPVLCLHATGHCARAYEPLAERVSDLPLEMVALDWPGQG
jgi:4,5:9,10-diseco-3-hydroxy-5,9,17-trioxoandrosta-1(10),2-diene-4-oate hydrolase